MSSEVSPGSDAEPGAEQQPPSAEAVVGFLKAHPDFFEQFPDALVAVSLPSAHGGRARKLPLPALSSNRGPTKPRR